LTDFHRSVECRPRRSTVLRVLYLEDKSLDAALVQAKLAEGGLDCELVRVQKRSDFVAALEHGALDLIMADYAASSFDDLSALDLARDARPETPFILLSGTIGEEVAVEAMKSGAADCVLKHRLERLVPAINRAIREAEERRQREQA
jgi:DNA-binding NtrC family response regulator